jgi:DNA-binding transcriptional MocR family regulator
VVEAYDRMVTMGYLQSRRGAGFYTAAAPPHAEAAHPAPCDKRNEQLVWLIRQLLVADDDTVLAGGPCLPNSWLDETGIRQSLNVLTRTAPICSNTGTRSAICRCASISR